MSSAAAEQMVDCARQAHISDVRLQRLKALTGGLAGRRLLEVGCGLGGFLLAAREEGAEVIGNDVSAGACEFVRERLGIQSHERPLAELPGEIGPVDVVVMSDLIEHPVSPLEMLKTARALLKRGGLLLIWTPNGGAAGQTAKTARNWVGFRVDLEHLQYFSAKTITRLALRQGWDIEHLETLGYPDLEGIDRHPVHSNGAGARQLKSWLKNVPGSRRFAAGVREVVSSFKGRQQEARCGTYHLFTIIRRG
jgi:2-polyprenyl-3-methyl-5-hydroxy-6-metoxy-1,4-benzoquinol methylase